MKEGIRLKKKKGLNYIADDNGRLLTFTPWLGDTFSFLYDFIMKTSIFPKKFEGSLRRHNEILSDALKGVRHKRVLELAVGSGSSIYFLPSDNQYSGVDISPGLLKKAVKRFRRAGFKGTEFYVASADDLPFEDNRFDVVLCILSLNFIKEVRRVFQEIKRVTTLDAVLVCCVPVPERNKRQSTIRGTLYTEEALAEMCKEYGFTYEHIPAENGVLLYFKAIKQA